MSKLALDVDEWLSKWTERWGACSCDEEDTLRAFACDLEAAMESNPEAVCLDCRLPYERFGLDVVFPNDEWKQIHSGVDGVLCATCIARRAAGVANVTAIRATLSENKLVPFRGDGTKKPEGKLWLVRVGPGDAWTVTNSYGDFKQACEYIELPPIAETPKEKVECSSDRSLVGVR